MYVADVVHVATLVGVESGHMQRQSPRVRQAKRARVVPTCMRINRYVACSYICARRAGAAACRGGCVGAAVACGAGGVGVCSISS